LTAKSLLERLSEHRTLSTVPRQEIEWVADHGYLHSLDAGQVLTSKTGRVEGLHVVLGGHLTIHVDGGSGRRKIMEWRGGDITGLMPYSRLVAPPGDVVAEEPTQVLTVRRDDLPQMILDCQELTAVLVHLMLDRSRHFTSSFLHDEKMVSLGKLAAGLAHELNNPASALARSAKALAGAVEGIETTSRALGAAGLTEEQLAVINAVRRVYVFSRPQSVRSPLEQEAREGSIENWLERHGANPAGAGPLAETDLTVEALDQLADAFDGKGFDTAVLWLAADFSTFRLITEIQESASRIYNLVASVKGFTQMDRAAVPEPVDIGQGITDTVVVLGSKAKAKSVSLSVRTDSGLPPVMGFGGELNQIWANLLDNALDAVNEQGHVELTAEREAGAIVVRVIDDGPGISAEIRNRIFDAFFTTKPVGAGTGLGLDIVRRLVQRHNGEIDFDSRPGLTEFRVRLPIADAAVSKGNS
jgi:signal transduction histidine kinase